MSFFAELKRRNVFKVGAAYAIVGWLLVQIIVSVEAPLSLPDWTDTLIILLLAVGFIVALFLAWAYELTPEGIKRAEAVPLSESITKVTGRKLDFAVIGLLVVLIGFMAAQRYLIEDTATPSESAAVLPNSIAVLPFENISPNPDDAYFAAGLHEEILNQLAKVQSISVISRTSVLRFADSDLSMPEIARELNVGTVMEGSVRYADGNVRITTQLIDAATDEHLWSETYEREFANIFAIESDIAMNIANALQAELSDTEQQSIDRIPTSSPEAYALYLRAVITNPYIAVGTSETISAIALLDRALELDDEFALAHSYKALLLANRGRGRPDIPDWDTSAEAAAQRALEIDPSSAWAHAALAGLYHANWREAEAQASFEEAYRLAPNDPDVLSAYAYFESDIGDYDNALTLGLRLVELDPTDADASQYLIGLIHLSRHDYDAAAERFRRSLEFVPNGSNLHMRLAMAEIARGNTNEGIQLLGTAEEFFEDTAYPPTWVAMMANAYARAGRGDDTDRLLAELERRAQEGTVANADRALAAIATGNYAEAMIRVEAAIEARELTPGGLQTIKANVYGDPVLEQPEWVALRERIHALN